MFEKFKFFISKQTRGFIHWLALLFADDDAHLKNPEAPTMKNFILFVLLIIFCIAFLKVVYLMEVVVKHDVRTNSQSNMQFKSMPQLEPDAVQPAQPQEQTKDQANYIFSIPDIPQNWQMIFLAGLGIMAAMSGAKHIADLKYSNGNGNSEPMAKAKGEDDK